MVIYKTTNLVNNKFYVGKDEKNDSKYLGSGKVLKLALSKYGEENFKKEILEECSNRKELNEKEKYWITVLSATTLGYNLAEGGTGGKTKLNTIPIYQYDLSGVFIKKWESAGEVKRVLKFDDSSIMKACKGKILSFKKYLWSYEYHEKIEKYNDTRTIKILQYDKKGIFIKQWDSLIEIQRFYNISNRHIQITLDNPRKTAKGFIWLRKKDKIINVIEVPKSGNYNNTNAKKKINEK
jgi:group I intron endonuclease